MRILIKRVAIAILVLSFLPATVQAASKKTKTLLGIAAGVIILNELSKQPSGKKHYKKKHYKKPHKKVKLQNKTWDGHCHTNGKTHYHQEFKGKYAHAHEKEEDCGAYRLDSNYDDGPGTGDYKPKDQTDENQDTEETADGNGDAWARCADKYGSFSSDGTYQPYGGGPRKVCPYL